MKHLNSFCCIVFLFTLSVFPQTAKKIDEYSYEPCGSLMGRMDSFHQELTTRPEVKLYIIYYEEKNRLVSVYNRQTKKHKIFLENPRFGNALNRAKEIPLYLNLMYKVPEKRITLIDGGFREKFELEVWIVPPGVQIPKPTPTIERNAIKFSKKKPLHVRNLAACYDGY